MLVSRPPSRLKGNIWFGLYERTIDDCNTKDGKTHRRVFCHPSFLFNDESDVQKF